jgi:hypothetical protein
MREMDMLDIVIRPVSIEKDQDQILTDTQTKPNQSKRSIRQPRSTYSGEVRLLDHLDGLTVDSLDEHVDVDVDVCLKRSFQICEKEGWT